MKQAEIKILQMNKAQLIIIQSLLLIIIDAQVDTVLSFKCKKLRDILVFPFGMLKT